MQVVVLNVTNFSKGKSLYRDGMTPLVRLPLVSYHVCKQQISHCCLKNFSGFLTCSHNAGALDKQTALATAALTQYLLLQMPSA